ncbi:BnaC06g10080D [Brassica napus]|uniref:BnaC06g10080D protein n=1 Tax=Brassica napus TaxID=3708 RepID=A0A078IMB3_BRANA|nr:BnaC06g10080D [Brassica napus]
MANSNSYLTTPTKTPSSRRNNQSQSKMQSHSQDPATSESRSRFEAYNRLQAAAVAFGEKLPIPEIVAIGGQSDGKSSLLEALLGFRFNVREVEMGTRRPLILQMALLRKTKTALSMPTLPISLSSILLGLFLRQRKESLRPHLMKSYRWSSHWLLLHIASSCSFSRVVWSGALLCGLMLFVRLIQASGGRLLLSPSLIIASRSLMIVVKLIVTSVLVGTLGRTLVLTLWPCLKTGALSQTMSFVDMDVIRHLREGVKGGFDEEKFRSHIGFGSLRDFLESELQKRYKDAAPATLALLEQRCSEVTDDMLRMDMKIQATSDVAHLRKAAMLYMASISNHGALIDGAANPAPEQWGKTTEEERGESGIGSWPGVCLDIKPPNAVLRLYGGAAFERVIHEFRCAAYSIECPPVSREKVANILLAHAGRGGGRGVTEASAEIARTAARSWLAPLLDTACDRLAFVLGSLFEIALERNLNQNSEYEKKAENMDGYVGFHAALRNCYSRFVKNLAKQCKQLVRHHLDSVTSPYSMACYESDYHQGGAFGSYYKPNQASGIGSFCFELSDTGRDEPKKDQENIPPEKSKAQETTPGKGEETHITVPETPSPDQPCEIGYDLVKKEIGNGHHHDGGGARKRVARMGGNRNIQPLRIQNGGGGLLFGTTENGMKSSSAYTEICSSAAQHFARIREVLVERSVTSTLNSGFLTPCRDRLVVALGVDLFAVNDEKFMDLFVAPGAIDVLQNERQQLQKRQKILHSCLTEFKTVSRSL